MSKSQLYHYFADKDDLVDAVIAHTVDQVLESQPHLADLSSWSAISAWFDDLVAFRVALKGRGGCPIGGLASELADRREEARLELAEAYARWEEPLRRGLETMRAARRAERRRRPGPVGDGHDGRDPGRAAADQDAARPAADADRPGRRIRLPALVRRNLIGS